MQNAQSPRARQSTGSPLTQLIDNTGFSSFIILFLRSLLFSLPVFQRIIICYILMGVKDTSLFSYINVYFSTQGEDCTRIRDILGRRTPSWAFKSACMGVKYKHVFHAHKGLILFSVPHFDDYSSGKCLKICK